MLHHEHFFKEINSFDFWSWDLSELRPATIEVPLLMRQKLQSPKVLPLLLTLVHSKNMVLPVCHVYPWRLDTVAIGSICRYHTQTNVPAFTVSAPRVALCSASVSGVKPLDKTSLLELRTFTHLICSNILGEVNIFQYGIIGAQQGSSLAHRQGTQASPATW